MVKILQVETKNLYTPDFGKGRPKQPEIIAHG